MKCPCQSDKKYDNCCGLVHQDHKKALTSEMLMRSRYSAYYLKNIEFLVKTTHPDKRSKNIFKEIQARADQTKWTKLEIISTKHGLEHDKIGFVEFKAYYEADGKSQILHENSRFRRYEGLWVYADGKIKS